MKNVRFEFTDADYELVTKAYKQYEKLAKDYDHKDFLFELLIFATIPIGFLVFSLAQRIINARFIGLINLIIIVCTIILYALFIMQSSIYTMKRNLTKKYGADCLDIKNNMEEARKTSGRLEFEDHDDEMNVIPWTYATNVPHEKFMIYEDGEPYCQGIVFQNDALREPVAALKTVEIELSREQFEKLKTMNDGDRARFYCKETKECFTMCNAV